MDFPCFFMDFRGSWPRFWSFSILSLDVSADFSASPAGLLRLREMRRSSSSSSVGQARRRVSLTLRTDPEGFSRGWELHPIARSGPRHSIGKSGLTRDGSSRATWIDTALKALVKRSS